MHGSDDQGPQPPIIDEPPGRRERLARRIPRGVWLALAAVAAIAAKAGDDVVATLARAGDAYDVGSLVHDLVGADSASAGSRDQDYLERVFPEGQLLSQLALIRAELRAREKVRNLTIHPDGELATYTRKGKRFFWIETGGEAPRRYLMREYKAPRERTIDLASVDIEVLRTILASVEREDFPPFDELDAITLTPHPQQERELMWTLRWAGPSTLTLYADAAGANVGRSYPR